MAQVQFSKVKDKQEKQWMIDDAAGTLKRMAQLKDDPEVTLRRFVDEQQVEPSVMAAVRDPMVRELKVQRVGHNQPCPCGSGEKFKKCCLWKVGCGVEIIGPEEGSNNQ